MPSYVSRYGYFATRSPRTHAPNTRALNGCPPTAYTHARAIKFDTALTDTLARALQLLLHIVIHERYGRADRRTRVVRSVYHVK